MPGLINQTLTAVGLGDITRAWLGDFDTALPAVGLIGIWVLLGFCTVLLLAGMTKIDPALYESARIDGANWFREFVWVTLPSLRYEIGVCLTVTVIEPRGLAFRRNVVMEEKRDKELLSEEQARRDFLRKAGRFAVVTPPAISLLLGTSLSSRAIAGSNGGKPGWAYGTEGHYGPPGQGCTPSDPC